MSLLKALVVVSGRIVQLPAADTVADFNTIANKPTTLAGYGIAASNVLATLLTVDGPGSGLDADTLDGINVGTSGTTIPRNDTANIFSAPFQVSGAYIFLNRTGAAAAGDIYIDRDAGFEANLNIRTGASQRWRWTFASTTAESGSNAGSDFQLKRYSDGGGLLATVITIPRSTGIADFVSTPTVGGSALMLASAYTAADVLAKLLTVDGPGSGIDADTLDGQSGAFYQSASNLNAGTLPNARLTGTYNGFVAIVFSDDLFYSKSSALIRGTSVDGSDNQALTLTGGGSSGVTRGATFQLYGNEQVTGLGRFSLQAGETATGCFIIGGGGTASTVQIYNGTTAGADDGGLFLAGGGAINSAARGGYINLYGEEHASQGGNVIINCSPAGYINIASQWVGGNIQTQNANYTLALIDMGGTVLHTNNTLGDTYTIPTNASVAFPIGAMIWVVNSGTAPVPISPAVGVTLLGGGASGSKSVTQNVAVMIKKVATNTWFWE